MKSLVWFIAGVLVGFLLAFNLGHLEGRHGEAERDTVVVSKTDTIRDTLPVEAVKEVVRYKTVRVRVDSLVRDTVSLTDTAWVSLPIERKVYRDSSYTAWVSGYDAKLDSIEVYRSARTITIVERETRKRWHIGPTAGAAYGIRGFTPYVGVGITYSLYSF